MQKSPIMNNEREASWMVILIMWRKHQYNCSSQETGKGTKPRKGHGSYEKYLKLPLFFEMTNN